ncbi:MAG: metallophosphatase family protein [Bacteroides fragilis]|nr:metallophosphatase family protein [Bacteroides fragilis]
MMHKIAVLSDTHGLLRPEIREILRGCEIILHGGDINRQKLLDELNQIAPVYVVRGNNDKDWAEGLPETRAFALYGLRFFMTHNKKQVPKDIDAEIVIYGHSHKYEEKYDDGKLFLNPGSCGPGRFGQPVTMAILEVEEGSGEEEAKAFYRVKKIEISRESFKTAGNGPEEPERLPGNIRQVITAVMKDTDKGRTVQEIAGRNGISPALAEQICRLYLTHPGVDAEGIMGKMGL